MSAKSLKNKDSSESSIYWSSHLKSWESSGLNQSEYCRHNNLNYSVFHYWKRKLSQSRIIGPLSKLVELDESLVSRTSSFEKPDFPGMGADRPVLRLWVGSDFCIDVDENFSSAVLSRLLGCLGSF